MGCKLLMLVFVVTALNRHVALEAILIFLLLKNSGSWSLVGQLMVVIFLLGCQFQEEYVSLPLFEEALKLLHFPIFFFLSFPCAFLYSG